MCAMKFSFRLFILNILFIVKMLTTESKQTPESFQILEFKSACQPANEFVCSSLDAFAFPF